MGNVCIKQQNICNIFARAINEKYILICVGIYEKVIL
jgi:hypothetical protein